VASSSVLLATLDGPSRVHEVPGIGSASTVSRGPALAELAGGTPTPAPEQSPDTLRNISGSAVGTLAIASTLAASPHPQVTASLNRSRTGPSTPWTAVSRLEAVFHAQRRNPGV